MPLFRALCPLLDERAAISCAIASPPFCLFTVTCFRLASWLFRRYYGNDQIRCPGIFFLARDRGGVERGVSALSRRIRHKAPNGAGGVPTAYVSPLLFFSCIFLENQKYPLVFSLYPDHGGALPQTTSFYIFIGFHSSDGPYRCRRLSPHLPEKRSRRRDSQLAVYKL